MIRAWWYSTGHPATWFVAALVILIGSAIGLSTPAHADPVEVYSAWKAENVCNWLSLHPQASAVAPLFKAIQDDTGFSGEDVARVLVTAAGVSCPESMPVLQRFVDLNSTPTFKTSRVGGVLHG